MSDGWVFTPDEGATSDVPDGDYLHYGFWLRMTTDSDGALTFEEVETFAGSSVAASGSVAGVTGSATYEGGATGVYARETFKTTDGTIDSASFGHFTARASLSATFGQVNDDNNEGTLPPNLLNTLTGTIDDFALSGGEENDWSVSLLGDIAPAAGEASGTAIGDGDPGTFSAAFHGPVLDEGGDPVAPHSLVGEFNANFSNGIVAGAFGARKR